MGSCPSWYPLLVAAKWLGVPPWELAQQPTGWMDAALAAIQAEQHAQEVANR